MTRAPWGSRRKWLDGVAVSHESDFCLIFPFPLTNHGYGAFNIGRKKVAAHRYVCEKVWGPQPRGHECAHRCGNSRCVNPAHLCWKTRSENHKDKIAHGTTNRGERHYGHKLTAKQVLAIRSKRAPQADIAAQYGISQTTVSDIKRKRKWAWL